MPPQVKASCGTTVQQPPVPEDQKDTKATSSSATTKEATASETAQAEPKKAQEDPKAAAKSHRSSQQHAKEKMKEQTLNGQIIQRQLHKKVGKNEPEGLWQSMKNVAHSVAVESFNKTARVVDAATATAKMMDGANKANEIVTKGLEKTRYVTAEARGADLAAEVKRIGSSKATFAEKEELIKKIHDYRQVATETQLQTSGIYHQESLKPPGKETVEFGVIKYERERPFQEVNKFDPKENRMTGGLTNILGSYGYHDTQDNSKQTEILDTALHNWNVTNPVDRASIHMRGNSGYIPGKDWKTPPDTRMSDRAYEAKQEVANPALPLNYGKDYFGPRGSEPDIDMVDGQARKNFTDVGNAIAASAGPVHGTPAAEPAPPKAPQRPTVLLRTAPSQTSGQAKGGGPLDKTQPGAAYEPTVQKQNMAYEPPADTGPKRPPQNTQVGTSTSTPECSRPWKNRSVRAKWTPQRIHSTRGNV